MTHTPGPWTLKQVRDVTDEYECFLHPLDLHIHDRISDADARLIAAAPDLLEACEEIQRQVGPEGLKLSADRPWQADIIKKVFAAVAKAKGGDK